MDKYKTKDIYEASALMAFGLKFLTLEPQDRFFWFVFNDSDTCEQTANSYWSNELSIKAKNYADAIRSLKDMLFARQR